MKRLPLPSQDISYWKRVREIAEAEGFDGCTGVPDFYLPACDEHDYHYKYHVTLYGDSINQEEADDRFKLVIQDLSPFKVRSPMSWWRWAALRVVGGFAWKTRTRWVG